MSKELPDFLRRLAGQRNAGGDGIWELLIESAEFIEALESDESEPPKTDRITETAAPTASLSKTSHK
jgi:hypothetical protein